jgi:hypothetical protein
VDAVPWCVTVLVAWCVVVVVFAAGGARSGVVAVGVATTLPRPAIVALWPRARCGGAADVERVTRPAP